MYSRYYRALLESSYTESWTHIVLDVCADCAFFAKVLPAHIREEQGCKEIRIKLIYRHVHSQPLLPAPEPYCAYLSPPRQFWRAYSI